MAAVELQCCTHPILSQYRSNSAMAPTTWNISQLDDVLRSRLSRSDRPNEVLNVRGASAGDGDGGEAAEVSI